MPKAFDDTLTPRYLDPLPCGGIPVFDDDSGYAYRCDACGAVVGSMAMPRECAELWSNENNKRKVWEILND